MPRAIDGYQGVLGKKDCFQRAKYLGYDVFAIQNNGECFTTSRAGETYKQYGRSKACSADGSGGVLALEVYNITKKSSYKNHSTPLTFLVFKS